MITILTWNIQNKKNDLIYSVLLEMLIEHDIDIFIVQECFGKYINTAVERIYDEIIYPENGFGSGVRIFLKKGVFKHFSIQRSKNRKLVFIHLKCLKTNEEFNLAAVHLHSKVNNSERQQLWKNLPIFKEILEFEISSSNNHNTIIAGDFNHNPFENNLVDPNMLHCIGNRSLIKTLTKISPEKNKFNLWYNPMWNLVGDYKHPNNERVTGTYFRYTEDESPMWNLFDGFIVRPTLMDKIDFNESEIIIKTNSENFLKPFIIREGESLIKEDLSDHLPVKLTININ